MSEWTNDILVDKIAYVYLEPNEMEEVNLITGIDPFHEVNFIDKSVLENTEVGKYIDSKAKILALIEGKIDYLCIRLDT